MSKKTFILSDETPNTYGIVVLTSGINLGRFGRNPVMLWLHERGSVVGKWDNVRVENKQLLAEPIFDTDDTKGADLSRKVEKGFVSAVSVSLAFDEADIQLVNGKITLTKSELMEVSFVDIPSNANAVKLCDAYSGKEYSQAQLKELALSLTKTPDAINMEKVTLAAMAAAAGLATTATEADVQAKIVELSGYKTKYEGLAKQIQDEQDKEATRLCDEAIKDKRLNATLKDSYLKLAKSDFSLFKETLANLPKPISLTQVAKGDTTASVELSTEELLVKEWDTLDKAGKLLKLKDEQPQRYVQLFKAKFGREPK